MRPLSLQPQDYAELYRLLDAPAIADRDCGAECSKWNDGKPVCCDRAAVPGVTDAEWVHLRGKKDRLGKTKWRPFKPRTAADRRLLHIIPPEGERLIECTGPARCARDNRSLCCRTFPFFPYFTPDHQFAGAIHYGLFDDWCWVLQNHRRVSPVFLAQFENMWLHVFARDGAELLNQSYQSRAQVGLYRRRKRPPPVLVFQDSVLTPSLAKALRVERVVVRGLRN